MKTYLDVLTKHLTYNKGHIETKRYMSLLHIFDDYKSDLLKLDRELFTLYSDLMEKIKMFEKCQDSDISRQYVINAFDRITNYLIQQIQLDNSLRLKI